jgi:hypothetical protein
LREPSSMAWRTSSSVAPRSAHLLASMFSQPDGFHVFASRHYTFVEH